MLIFFTILTLIFCLVALQERKAMGLSSVALGIMIFLNVYLVG